jgi:hypothetical protein
METLFERGLVLPAQAVKKINIKELASHSIGLGGVPSDFSHVTDHLRYQIRNVAQGDIVDQVE